MRYDLIFWCFLAATLGAQASSWSGSPLNLFIFGLIVYGVPVLAVCLPCMALFLFFAKGQGKDQANSAGEEWKIIK